MNESGVNLLGDRQLDDLFNKLKNSQKRSIVISAFRKASKPMHSAMKANLISRTKAKSSGNLAKSIGYRPVSRMPILHLGARRFGNFKGYHVHWLESGTVKRYTKSGAARGKVTATHFFKDAVTSKTKETVEGFTDAAIDSFAKLIRRANAKRKT